MKQPDYDFFVRPGERGSGQGGGPDPRFGGPAQPTDRFGAPADQPGAPVDQFGTPVNQFGTPVTPTPAWQPAPVPVRRGGLPGWAIGLLGLLVAGVVAAVAVPVFLNQRSKAVYQATTMQLPESVEGLPRRATDTNAGLLASRMQQQLDQGMPGVFTTSGAAYGGPGGLVYVVTGHTKRGLTAVEQGSIRLGLVAAGAQLTGQPAGRLGGDFRCLDKDGATSCVSTDPAGFVLVVIAGTARGDRVDQARRIREAVELRRG